MTAPAAGDGAEHRDCAAKSPAPLWNSLEIAKLIIPIALALLIAWIGYLISQALERSKGQESQQQHYENAVVTKRMALYDEIGRNINRLYSYYFYVGRWKEMTPEDVLKTLRTVDDVMFTYRPIFSKPFFESFIDLRDELFQKNNRWGEDLKLRTTVKFHKKYGKEWRDDSHARFTNEDNRSSICDVYNKFLTGLINELHVDSLTDKAIIKSDCPMYDITVEE